MLQEKHMFGGKTTLQEKKGIVVMDYLETLGMNYPTILDAICDRNVEASYRLIKENPNISKEEFLRKMNIEEWEDF